MTKGYVDIEANVEDDLCNMIAPVSNVYTKVEKYGVTILQNSS